MTTKSSELWAQIQDLLNCANLLPDLSPISCYKSIALLKLNYSLLPKPTSVLSEIRTVTPPPSQKIRVRETSQEAVAVMQVCDDGHRARLGSVGLQRKTETKPVVTDPPDWFDTGFEGEQRSVKGNSLGFRQWIEFFPHNWLFHIFVIVGGSYLFYTSGVT